MKKIVVIILLFLFTISPEAKQIEAGTKTTYNYSTTKKIIKEVMKDYYLRGKNIQYHAGRTTSFKINIIPEEKLPEKPQEPEKPDKPQDPKIPDNPQIPEETQEEPNTEKHD